MAGQEIKDQLHKPRPINYNTCVMIEHLDSGMFLTFYIYHIYLTLILSFWGHLF